MKCATAVGSPVMSIALGAHFVSNGKEREEREEEGLRIV